MSTSHGPSARPTGATPVGGKPNRRKWLAPLAIGLIVLIALLLLLSRCGGDDDNDSGAAPAGTAAPTNPASTAATPSAPASSTGQPGTDAGAMGTVIAGGDDLLSAQTSISKGGHDGDEAEGNAVKVQSVPADEGFWVGSSATERVWIQLSGTRGESDYKVKQGDTVNFTGTVKAAGKDFATTAGLSAAEGADQLTEQGHYISVPSSSVKLFK